jgi:hypothetical protein
MRNMQSTVDSKKRTVKGPSNSTRRLPILLAPLLALAALAVLAAAASAAPAVSITSPSEGATINSGTVPITLDIQNFTMNGSAVGMAAVAGEGHFHLFIDGAYIKYDFVPSTFLADVPAGAHVLTVALANNDHTLIGANAVVNVTIQAGAPRVAIVSPGWSTSWNSSSVELQISKDNFTYNPAAVGQAAAAGEGHYHVLVNGAYFFYGTTDFYNVTQLTPGASYALRVQLFNNDHTAIVPVVYDEIYITIAPSAPELKIDFSLFQANVNASSVYVPMTVNGFTIDPNAVGQPAVAGRGHYHAWLDGVFLGPAALNPLPLSDLSVGTHTLVLELRNNDHTELTPRVVDFTIFTVLANAPRVTITAPADPSTVNAASVEAEFTVGNFTLDASKVGQAPQAGTGHWHVLVDGVYIGYGADLVSMVSDLSQGPHVITIELHNNDHSALTWPAFDLLRIVVPSGAPKVTITSPGASSTVNSSSVVLNFTVANFTLDGSKVGQPPEAGIGHWHLYVDGVYTGYGATLSATAVHLAPGTHVLSVELHNNDHSDLTWPAFDSVTVTVPAGAPWIAITAPAAASTVPLNFTAVTVTVANFTLIPVGTAANAVGQGHWHLYLDGALFTMSASLSEVVTGLSAGSHTVRVELVSNDHNALAAPVTDEVTFSVGGLVPSIRLLSPSPGAIIYGNATALTVLVTNFTLSAAHVGQAPVAGEGHWHVFVDDVYSGFSATSSFDLTGLAVGDHTLKVELYNNDHSELGMDVVAQVTVHVGAVPSVRFTSPANGANITGTTLDLTFALSNFTLVVVGSTSVNAAGAGHLHVLVDGVLVQMLSTTSATLTNLSVGTHTIRVEISNNDHSDIALSTNSSTITVTVAAATTAPPPKGFLPGFEGAWAFAAVAAVAGLALVRRRRLA